MSESPSPALEEADLWWGGFSWRTMWPYFLADAAASILIIALAWSLGAWRGEWAVHHVALTLLIGLWVGTFVYGLFHALTFTYRLTNRRLFIGRGFQFRRPAPPGLPLHEIAQVRVERGALERLVGVGRVYVNVHNACQPTIILKGVRAPKRVALRFRKAIAEAGKERSAPPGCIPASAKA
jgi:membrane protein YdbS with pleckstrin-like domain